MLQKINIQPGFNKQVTATGGEGQWVGGDYVRFRYGTPEKIVSSGLIVLFMYLLQ